MDRIINCLPNLEKYSKKITNDLITSLITEGFQPYKGFNENAELNITIGGDGAFLHAVRESGFSQIPFIGINTGNLGFFPEITPDNVHNFIELYKCARYKINEISIIECIVYTDNTVTTTYAVNDIAIKRRDMKTAHLDTYFNNNYLQTVSGDGIIVSSPLGSSAYNYSAGGALVYPSLRTLQITPLSPLSSNAYRCLNSSIIVPPEFEVKIVPETSKNYVTTLVADGVTYDFEGVKSILFFTSAKTIKQLTVGEYNYWNVIKSKLL
ncbi:NAD(+)/NADH kinase [Sedimentibacter sp. zth1]|uniref:NAD(+)/NADH kinase n=1 Tax=Sedimentibacter sp. zth1 TaxID=2816908 RepID=UPI001A9217A8|nr:NAD(+)/NADH kinase [Sedimentibacter sp. zth1]QSX04741.1 NAD(+)/NADH kinase [Sedimentibacter sp. zth1]